MNDENSEQNLFFCPIIITFFKIGNVSILPPSRNNTRSGFAWEGVAVTSIYNNIIVIGFEGKDQVEEDMLHQKKVRGSSSNITDDFFDCLRNFSIVDHEERMLFVEERRGDVQIDDSLFEKLDEMNSTPPPMQSSTSKEDKARFFIGEEHEHFQYDEDWQIESSSHESADLGKFMTPIEQENERRIQHVGDMFDRIESLDQIMYEELLNKNRLSRELSNTDGTHGNGKDKTTTSQTSKTTKEEEKVSGIEKTRNDVDKMLLNCQNIDKINSSLTDTVPNTTSPSSTSLNKIEEIQKSRDSENCIVYKIDNPPGMAKNQIIENIDYGDLLSTGRSTDNECAETNFDKISDQARYTSKTDLSSDDNAMSTIAKELTKSISNMTIINVSSGEAKTTDGSTDQETETRDINKNTASSKVNGKPSENNSIEYDAKGEGLEDNVNLSLTSSTIVADAFEVRSRTSSEDGTPPTPGFVQNLPPKDQVDRNSVNEKNDHLIEKVSSAPNKNLEGSTTSIVSNLTSENTDKEIQLSGNKSKEEEVNEEQSVELSASPFTFSLVQKRAKRSELEEEISHQKKLQPQEKTERRRSSYLEKRQSHTGLFSPLTKSTSLTQLKKSVSLTSLNSLTLQNSLQSSGLGSIESSIPEGLNEYTTSSTLPFQFMAVSSNPFSDLLQSSSTEGMHSICIEENYSKAQHQQYSSEAKGKNGMSIIQ